MRKFYEFPIKPTAKDVLDGYKECYDEAVAATEEFYKALDVYEEKLHNIWSLSHSIVNAAASNPDTELTLHQFAMVTALDVRVSKLLGRFNGLRCEMKANA